MLSPFFLYGYASSPWLCDDVRYLQMLRLCCNLLLLLLLRVTSKDPVALERHAKNIVQILFVSFYASIKIIVRWLLHWGLLSFVALFPFFDCIDVIVVETRWPVIVVALRRLLLRRCSVKEAASSSNRV